MEDQKRIRFLEFVVALPELFFSESWVFAIVLMMKRKTSTKKRKWRTMVAPIKIITDTLEDLVQEHLNISKDLVEEEDQSLPMAVGYSIDTRYIFPMLFRNDEEKMKMVQVVSLLFAVHGVTRYTFSSEAHMLDGTDDTEYQRLQKEGKRISESPNAIEILICVGVSKTENITETYKIKEGRKLEKFMDDEAITTGKGTFYELLPTDDLTPEERKILKMEFTRLQKIFGVEFTEERFE